MLGSAKSRGSSGKRTASLVGKPQPAPNGSGCHGAARREANALLRTCLPLRSRRGRIRPKSPRQTQPGPGSSNGAEIRGSLCESGAEHPLCSHAPRSLAATRGEGSPIHRAPAGPPGTCPQIAAAPARTPRAPTLTRKCPSFSCVTITAESRSFSSKWTWPGAPSAGWLGAKRTPPAFALLPARDERTEPACHLLSPGTRSQGAGWVPLPSLAPATSSRPPGPAPCALGLVPSQTTLCGLPGRDNSSSSSSSSCTSDPGSCPARLPAQGEEPMGSTASM